MISAQTANLKSNFFPAPPINQTAARATRTAEPLDTLTKHRIYDRLLDLLTNPRIRVKETVLPSVLHPLTKKALADDHGFTAADIAELEAQITRDADENLLAFEVTRDAPAELFRALGESDSIIENRIAPLPNATENALLCETLQKEFSRRTLLACDGFMEQRDRDARGIVHKFVRLDLGDWLVRRGFAMPVYRGGLISALKIFRHPGDEKPFRLKSRTTEAL